MRLRSVLYMPGANERALEKAKQIPADALILDLEDAVAPTAKSEARERVCAAASSGAYGDRTIAIRVNGIGTEWHQADLNAAAAAGPDAILIPKVATVEELLGIEQVLTSVGAHAHTRLWAMLETPTAVLNAADIAKRSDLLSVLVMGTNDLANELYCEPGDDRGSLLTSLQLCLLAARGAGKMIVDGVYNDVRNLDAFAAECEHGRRLGFDGKTLIHPDQVGICNRVFSPSPEDIAHARRVITTFQEAESSGSGVATIDGRLIESLHVETARRTLSLADHEG